MNAARQPRWRVVALASLILGVAILHTHFNRPSSACSDGNCLTPYASLVPLSGP